MDKLLICLLCVSLLVTSCGTPAAVTPTTMSATDTPPAPTSIASPVVPTVTLAPPTATAVPPTAFPTPRTDCKERYPTSPAERDYWPTDEWRVSSLAEHCLDPEKVEHAAWYLEKGLTARSLLIIRHGELVYEKYFRSIQKPDRTANVRSVTKSVLSALVGIAMDQGLLDSLDHKVVEYFPEYFYPTTDPRMAEVSLRHLLTMSTGFKWAELGPVEIRDRKSVV